MLSQATKTFDPRLMGWETSLYLRGRQIIRSFWFKVLPWAKVNSASVFNSPFNRDNSCIRGLLKIKTSFAPEACGGPGPQRTPMWILVKKEPSPSSRRTSPACSLSWNHSLPEPGSICPSGFKMLLKDQMGISLNPRAICLGSLLLSGSKLWHQSTSTTT